MENKMLPSFLHEKCIGRKKMTDDYNSVCAERGKSFASPCDT